jgi:hypothetical protein
MATTTTPIKALDANGAEFWWTGRAGNLWVSANAADAFRGLSLDGARRKAAQFNRMTEIHGLRFVAVVAEAA